MRLLNLCITLGLVTLGICANDCDELYPLMPIALDSIETNFIVDTEHTTLHEPEETASLNQSLAPASFLNQETLTTPSLKIGCYSISIGVLTGSLCIYTDQARFPYFPSNLLVCSLFRMLLVDTLVSSPYTTTSHVYTISTLAWLADWITYIMIKFRRR